MSGFVDFVIEQLAGLGAVESRRMFGGYGLFYGGLMIGLVARDVLYLKADDQTQEQFAATGARPFTYNKAGKLVTTSYYEAPPETLDDPGEMKLWAQRAYDAACRSRKG